MNYIFQDWIANMHTHSVILCFLQNSSIFISTVDA